MRQVARKGLITMAAASGVLALAAGYAQADAGAAGGAANSPGVGSGNNVQVPVHVPVNACGNTVNVVGLLNPAFGNRCANVGGGGHQAGHAPPGRAHGCRRRRQHLALSGCRVGQQCPGSGRRTGECLRQQCLGRRAAEPGLRQPLRQRVVAHPGQAAPPGEAASPGQAPDHPGKPHHPSTPHQPGKPHQPGNPSQQTPHKPGTKPQTGGHSQQVTPAKPVGHLAQTGAGSIGYAVPASAGMLLGGALLYRKARAARR